MDKLDPQIARLITAKEQRRHKLAALPFAEKVRLVVKLQQMAAPVLTGTWTLGGGVDIGRSQAGSPEMNFSR